MENITDKKWFVYLADHQEGPFSFEEIENKYNQHIVSKKTFVWGRGMDNWKTLIEIDDFNRFFSTDPYAEIPVLEPKTNRSLLENTALTLVEDLDEFKKRAVLETSEAPEIDKKAEEGSTQVGFKYVIALTLSSLIATCYHVSLQWQGQMENFIASVHPYFFRIAEQLPVIDRWVSPIPFLEDVSLAEYQELKEAATVSQAPGMRAAIAVAKANPLFPQFYISTHYPNEEKWILHIQGISDTLLNQISYQDTVQINLSKKLFKTKPLHLLDGRPIPKGEYLLFLTPGTTPRGELRSILHMTPALSFKLPSTLPKEATVVAFKHYFLGGERDINYISRLKSFHDKLSAQAKSEIAESSQFLATLQSQLESTELTFQNIRKTKNVVQRHSQWIQFDLLWNKLESQLDSVFQKWSSETIQSNFFYTTLYQLVRQSGEAVKTLHLVQDQFFRKPNPDLKVLETEVKVAFDKASSLLNQLKGRISLLENTPASPNGMPKRDL